jgi:hypothetical protein
MTTHFIEMKFFSNHLFSRINEHSTIPRVGKLTHEFIVDVWATTEQERLCWVQMNQRTLRISLSRTCRYNWCM